jgi:fibronectin type III domain protein
LATRSYFFSASPGLNLPPELPTGYASLPEQVKVSKTGPCRQHRRTLLGDLGLNSFTVAVSNGRGGSDSATLQITVVAPLSAPTNLIANSTTSKKIDLAWTDSSAGESGFKIERSSNGKSYSQIATVGANVTAFSDTGLRSGRKYYYRVRAYSGTSNSAYSNIASMTAK